MGASLRALKNSQLTCGDITIICETVHLQSGLSLSRSDRTTGQQMEQNDRREILAIRELSKTFGDTVALDNVHFNLYSGEVHCLVGENGAGKSTLIKILSGAEKADKGRIIAFGIEYSRLTPHQSLEMGIATIYQDVELVSSLTVADNIFLGHEIKTNFGRNQLCDPEP